MLVKQLVGRLAGEIVDLPAAEAQACIAAGTAAEPAEEELQALADADAPPPPAKPKRTVLDRLRGKPA